MLASPRLKAMFSGPWAEANSCDANGLNRWELGEIFDHEAFTTVMNIIHGRNRTVPRSVNLEMLAKISVVVDDLSCFEAMEVFSKMWITELRGSLPSTYCRNLVFWIFISSVFREGTETILTSTTRTAVLNSQGEIDTLGLPIRHDIVGT